MTVPVLSRPDLLTAIYGGACDTGGSVASLAPALTIASASTGVITRTIDGQDRVVGMARQARIVIEGHEVHHCHRAEELGGIVTALCYVERNGRFVLGDLKPLMKTITGRGHIFFPGCCGGRGEWWG